MKKKLIVKKKLVKKEIQKEPIKKRILKEKEKGGKFAKDDLEDSRKKVFISSGCDMLNLALTGNIDKAYVRGRMVNAVGDSSAGKTALANEVISWAIYHLKKKQKKKVVVIYDDPEMTYDFELAESQNVPLDDIIFINSDTVEDFQRNLWRQIKKNPDAYLIIYVLDSLDSLASKKEKEKLIKGLNKAIAKEDKEEAGESVEEEKKEAGSYGMGKAKGMSDFFKNMTRELSKTNCLLFIISQVREDITIVYGDKQKRTGGKAMDFYATSVIWLYKVCDINTKEFTKGKEKYQIALGVTVLAKVKKNKIGKPFRKAKFDILFEYGVDNLGSLVNFGIRNGLIKGDQWLLWKDKKYRKDDLINFFAKNKEDLLELRELVQGCWDEIENEAIINRPPKWEE